MATKTSVTAPEKRGRGRPPGSVGKPREPREKTPPTQLGYRINELAAALRLSRAAIMRAVGNGEIRAVKIGSSYVVPVAELKRLGLTG